MNVVSQQDCHLEQFIIEMFDRAKAGPASIRGGYFLLVRAKPIQASYYSEIGRYSYNDSK